MAEQDASQVVAKLESMLSALLREQGSDGRVLVRLSREELTEVLGLARKLESHVKDYEALLAAHGELTDGCQLHPQHAGLGEHPVG